MYVRVFSLCMYNEKNLNIFAFALRLSPNAIKLQEISDRADKLLIEELIQGWNIQR